MPRLKPIMTRSGWYRDSYRHSLAARGISTSRNSYSRKDWFIKPRRSNSLGAVSFLNPELNATLHPEVNASLDVSPRFSAVADFSKNVIIKRDEYENVQGNVNSGAGGGGMITHGGMVGPGYDLRGPVGKAAGVLTDEAEPLRPWDLESAKKRSFSKRQVSNEEVLK